MDMKKGMIGIMLGATLAATQLGCNRSPSKKDIEDIKLSQLSEMEKVIDSSGEAQQVDKAVLLQKLQQERQEINQKRKKRKERDEADALGLLAAFGMVVGLVTINAMKQKPKNKVPQKAFDGALCHD